MNNRYKLSHLSDQQLIEATHRSVRSSNAATAMLLAHIAEMDARRLYLRKAKPSMFQYAVDVLVLSNAAAFNRINAARAARDYPQIFEMVASGETHLTAIKLVRPHLTQENHCEVLGAIRRKTKRQIELYLAECFPQADVPQVVRKLPQPQPVAEQGPKPVSLFRNTRIEERGTEPTPSELPSRKTMKPTPSQTQTRGAQPLAPGRYKVQVTISEETHQKLEKLQELLRHQIPDGDLAKVLDKSLDVLLEKELKRRFGVTKRTCKKPVQTNSSGKRRSRHVPNAVKREVLARDGLRCSYVSGEGERCTETGCLELHHERAFAKGGEHSAENIRVMCRAHNLLAAEGDFGMEHMAQFTLKGVG